MRNAAMTVLVLHEDMAADARPDEADILAQVTQISATMKVCHSSSVMSTDLDLAALGRPSPTASRRCVFNLVESLGGDGRMVHFVPALLQSAGVPFTGSVSDALYLSSQKLLAKQLDACQQDSDTGETWTSNDEPMKRQLVDRQIRVGACLVRHGRRLRGQGADGGAKKNRTCKEVARRRLVCRIVY